MSGKRCSLFTDQLVHDFQAFTFALTLQNGRVVAVGSTVIHVNVKIGSHPGSMLGGKAQVALRFDFDLCRLRLPELRFRSMGFSSNPL